MPDNSKVPEHVITAFQGAEGAAEPAGHAWDNGWKIGQAVYSRTTGVTSGWAAKTRSQLQVDGVRIARPLRSTDGRFVVGGWKASTWVPGGLERRVDEAVLVALRVEEALHAVAAPPAREADDPFVRAENLAWEETSEQHHHIDLPLCLGHADVLGTTIFHGTQAPVLTEIVPCAAPRPAGFSAALVIADGLIAGAVDQGIIERYAHIPELGQLLLRAIAYRRHINTLHPAATSNARSYITGVEETLVSHLDATM